MSAPRLRIAVDMDEVLVDTVARQLEWFHETYGYTWTKASLAGKRYEDVADVAHVLAHEAVLHDGAFFEDLPPMEGAIEVLRDLAAHHEVFIATAAMDYPGSLAPKYRWLRRHVPFISPSHYVFLGDKSVLATDVLVDDNSYQFRRFAGTGILFTAPHNAHETGYVRALDWNDVARLVRDVGCVVA